MAQIYKGGSRVPPRRVSMLGMKLQFAPRRYGAGVASVIRESARGRTVPRYSGVHVRATGTTIAGCYGLRTRKRWFRCHSYPWAPEKELGEATAKSATHKTHRGISVVKNPEFIFKIKLYIT